MELQITGVALLEDGGLEIGYLRLPQDVRKNGLVWQHAVRVPVGTDYDDEIEAFQQALVDLLEDVLDDEDRAEPIELKDEDDEDEEEDD
jgi:hypothetical protein